ncbi:glycosyltransferase family 4 protein [Alphaproteobacteria bacterium LSUCC0719]
MPSATPAPTASLANITPLPRIDILLPSKERFGPANAGAISGVVLDQIRSSATPACFRIVGTAVDQPFDDTVFLGLHPRHQWLHGSNIGLAAAYLHALRDAPPPDLVEVHSRCHVAAYLKARRPDMRVALYLHNDPREMKGSRTVSDRRKLLSSLSAVICVSDHIRDCFLDGIADAGELASKVATARNGATRWLKAPAAKEKMILLAGRMVPEKGILEFAQALAKVMPDHPEWDIVIAGARRFEDSAPGSYEGQIAKALEPLGTQARMTGFLPLEQVHELQQKAAIIACPSIWHDPMPKAVLEALAAGSALLTTRRGGIPEVAEGRAHIVDTPDVQGFADALGKLVNDDDYRTMLQQRAWSDFPFTADQMAADADSIRATALISKAGS